MMKNTKAFTLAEVLITIVIIGVVAALTIPTLVHRIETQERVAKYKKAVADLNVAVGLMKLDSDSGDVDPRTVVPDGSWGSSSFYDMYLAQYFQKYFKGSKVGDLVGNGASNPIKFLDGTSPPGGYYEAMCTRRELWLENGVHLHFWSGSWNDNKVWIDVNGKKGPNTLGKDVFRYAITNRRLIPENDGNPCKLGVTTTGYSCSVWFLSNSDYEQ